MYGYDRQIKLPLNLGITLLDFQACEVFTKANLEEKGRNWNTVTLRHLIHHGNEIHHAKRKEDQTLVWLSLFLLRSCKKHSDF